MNPVLRIAGGAVECVYDDRWMPILKALGVPHARRATRLEPYTDTWGRLRWVAADTRTGEPLAEGETREEVLAAEIRILNERLRKESLL